MLGNIKRTISIVMAILMIATATIPSFATTEVSYQSTVVDCVDVDIPIISSFCEKIIEIFKQIVEYIRNIINPQEEPPEGEKNPEENPGEENNNPEEIPEGKIKVTWKFINIENKEELEWIEQTDYYEYGDELIVPDIPTNKPSYSGLFETYVFITWTPELETTVTQDMVYSAQYRILY